MAAQPGITPQQAFYLDQKIDDANPQHGFVTARFIYSFGGMMWADWWTPRGPPYTGPISVSPSGGYCYDNGGIDGAQMHYSIAGDNGNGITCAAMIQFQ
jgi:hypothetical protein